MNSQLTDPTHAPDDALLMAYADDKLAPEERARVERLLETQPELRALVAAFKESATQARTHWPTPAPAVPAALQANVLAMIAKAQANEAAAASQSEAPRPALPLATPAPESLQLQPAANNSWYAMVATVAFAAVGTLSYFAGAHQAGGSAISSAPSSALVLTADASQTSQWQEHLNRSPSGVLLPLTSSDKNVSKQMKILATVRDAQGNLCREFSIDQTKGSTLGVACHQADQKTWQVQFAAHMPEQANGYTPASSAQVMDAFISSIGAGAALAADEEKKALAGLGAK
ncbi:hypothetical protein [Variovorax sp. PCZ-1]|uniref:anti-sigma factor family protein n=1 Tax=Variovorax sp. PCZ-1 TaxID=2835533 RepID=UPI001BCE2AF3|nr:hypothetical protein [Variovorax sp. PCZ-1]MBS7806505.1 hypothetical protein [Variovorax sp. PCZ-1]